MKKINVIGSTIVVNLFLLVSKIYAADDPIGRVNPTGLGPIFSVSGVSADGRLVGPLTLINLLLRILFIVAGLYAFMNIILAGFGFISAQGDSKKVEAAWTKIWQSVIGLVIIVASFLFAAVIGILIFKDATYLLNPKI